MIQSFFHNHLFLISILWYILATVHAQTNVSVGDSLHANDKNMTWNSPSGDFAFGFHPLPGQKNQFLLAIWYAKIPEKTIVWHAINDGEQYPAATGRESNVELIGKGHLVLKDPKGKELWRSQNLITGDSQLSHAAMLDTGNFVIATKNSSANIWESFKYPTDTILPTQKLDVDGILSSALAENSYGKGKYQLRLNNGSIILNQVDMFTGKPYEGYFSFGNGSRLIFNESGLHPTGSLHNLAPDENYAPKPELNYYRATLGFYGVLTLYYYPRNNTGSSWAVVWFKPDDICNSSVALILTSGIGPCGYNSLCDTMNNIGGRPNCTCPPGFSLLDGNNQYGGCKQDYTSYPLDCNPDGSTREQDRFEFKPSPTLFSDFSVGAYGILTPATESECKQSCLRDCSCTVIVMEDPDVSKDHSNGTCWKKRLPLSNGVVNRKVIDRTVFFKVLKSDNSRINSDSSPNPRDRNQNTVILILAILLGTSACFNFLSLAAISLILFCLYRKRLQDVNGINHSRGDLETNLRSFAYKELERATNGFKEEIGRGAFGTVYKGDLPSSYGHYHVAVKKLEKFVQEGEKEFKTEVEVIGQTHHKNLVRLIGYCDEGEHRLLVYEFMGNGSLSSFLFGVLRPSWERRLQIASGIAKGLTYLHEECSRQIIHCDIKPQNILLDDSFTAKISDFGLAKLLINNKTRTRTGIRGTKGYVAPEWFRNTPVTVKADVYSFGVMLLEIICCRKCVHVEMEEAAILTEWVAECYRSETIEKLVEKDEEARSDVGKLEMLLKVAIWCVQEIPTLRPSMRTVTMMLEGAVLVPPPPYPFLVDSMSGSSMM